MPPLISWAVVPTIEHVASTWTQRKLYVSFLYDLETESQNEAIYYYPQRLWTLCAVFLFEKSWMLFVNWHSMAHKVDLNSIVIVSRLEPLGSTQSHKPLARVVLGF